MKNILSYILFILLGLACSQSFSSEYQCKPDYEKQLEKIDDKYKDLAKVSLSFSEAFCIAYIQLNMPVSPTDIATFSSNIEHELTQLNHINEEVKTRIKTLIKTNNLKSKGKISSITTAMCDDNNHYSIHMAGEGKACTESDKIALQSKKEVDSMLNALSLYAVTFQNIELDRFLTHSGNLRTQWESYFKHSRTQTPIDLFFSKLISRQHIDKFNAPPNRQYFFLHPMPVYEYNDSVDQGEKTDTSLLIEVFGVNWWRGRGNIPPLGFSLGTLLTDKEDVHPSAPSAVLHYDNTFSLGFAYREEDKGGSSFFMSLDFLDFFKNTDKRLEKLGF